MFIPEEFRDDRDAAIEALVTALQAASPRKDSDGVGINVTEISVDRGEITVDVEVVIEDIEEANFNSDECSARELREDEDIALMLAETIFDGICDGALDEDDALVGYEDEE
jgi:hypothetical protein